MVEQNHEYKFLKEREFTCEKCNSTRKWECEECGCVDCCPQRDKWCNSCKYIVPYTAECGCGKWKSHCKNCCKNQNF